MSIKEIEDKLRKDLENKKVITNSMCGLQYFLEFTEIENSYYDENNEWLADVFKIDDDIRVLVSWKYNIGKRLPRIEILDFEQHAKTIYEMEDKEEKEKLSKKLIECFVDYVEENYEILGEYNEVS